MKRMMLMGMLGAALMLFGASGSWAWTTVRYGGPAPAQAWNAHPSEYRGGCGLINEVDARIQRQESMILHGAARGQITPGEERVLYGNLSRIRGTEARYAWDGRITSTEYQSLDRMLDQNRVQIERASHDYDGYWHHQR